MGLLLKRKKFSKGWKYRFYSTIIDGYLTDWLKRSDAIEWIKLYWMQGVYDKIEQEEKNFPDGWIDKATHKRISHNNE